ncbi:MAG: LysE family transporter [Chitinophagaceae bacterium]
MMIEIIKIFFTGFGISLLGTLPLGSLNVAAMQISVQENYRNAIRFALGVALVEIIYVRISLQGMRWVIENQRLFRILEWCTVGLFIVLAITSFLAARKKSDEKNILLKNNVNRFWLGLTMSAINPVQIPFWFIWSTYLISNGLLKANPLQYNTYTVGIGLGTLSGLAFFIFGGKWLVAKMKASHRVVNFGVGIIFVISAVIQFYRLVTKPAGEEFKTEQKGKLPE